MLLPVRRPYKAFATNLVSSGLTAKSALVKVKPSGNGIVDLTGDLGNGLIPPSVRIFPYGLGANNNAFSLRVWGWVRYAKSDLWLSSILAEVVCTMGQYVGLAGTDILNTEAFCDTLVLVAAVGEATITADVTRLGTAKVYSPANDTPGFIQIATRGVELLEFDGATSSGTPTMNALVQTMEDIP